MATTFELVLLYLVAAVAGVVACRSLRLPPMLGYLAVGVLIGPNALALAKDSAGIRYLAEFGVVFLMFVIGLEFNLPKLLSMRTLVFGLGLSQVGLTIAAAVVGNLAIGVVAALGGHAWGLGWHGAVALGGALAMSSTAIVVKLMAERLELETEHGRRVMGVLLFQDLAVVPLLVIIPALGGPAGALGGALAIAALKAGLLLVLLLVGGPRVMRWWLTLVARRKSEELFVLNLLLVTLGLAWITEHAGLSLALGAFVAGMLIAETEFKHQVETDIRPFHDVLLGLFFITIGMKLDWRAAAAQWPLVLAMMVLPVLFKFALVTALAQAVPRARRGGAAYRALPGAGRRIRLRAADAGDRPPAAAGQRAEPGADGDGAVDDGHPVHHPVQRPHRHAALQQRLDDAVAGGDVDRPARHQHRGAHHHLRLRAQRPEPGAAARSASAFRTSRSTSTPTACARPRPPARASSSATQRGCRA